jgi:hypothetical protein
MNLSATRRFFAEFILSEGEGLRMTIISITLTEG